jgi:hypothetical protein
MLLKKGHVHLQRTISWCKPEKMLSAISPLYGVNPSVGTVLEIFSVGGGKKHGKKEKEKRKRGEQDM